MNTTIVNGYHVAGNYYIAIAINVNDPKDAHYFTDDPLNPNKGAFNIAIAWTSPGL